MRVHRPVVAAAAALALSAASASCRSQDRAAGTVGDQHLALTFAQANDGPPVQLRLWADQVGKESKGMLEIRFLDNYHRGDPSFEPKTVADVRSGKVDAAWVGARAFDQVGVNSFQPLLAPLLVDSYELEAKVFEAGIPDQMVTGLSSLGLHGVGVLPGPLRKVLSKGKPLTGPGAFRGLDVGIQRSGVAERTFAAWGATTTPLPSGADISGVDAFEQQMESVAGNHYEDKGATSVTGNLNVWPRPLVLFVGDAAWARLSAAQRNVLTSAAHDVAQPSLKTTVTEDASATGQECGYGLPLVQATEQQLSALRSAVQPVYDTIASDSRNRTWLEQIASIRSRLGARAAVAACPSAGVGPAATTTLEGTYGWTLTAQDWASCGPGGGTSTNEVELKNGTATQWDTTGGKRELAFKSRYSVYRDTFQLGGPDQPMTMRWRLEGDQLVLTDMHGGGCDDKVVWTSRPLIRR